MSYDITSLVIEWFALSHMSTTILHFYENLHEQNNLQPSMNNLLHTLSTFFAFCCCNAHESSI